MNNLVNYLINKKVSLLPSLDFNKEEEAFRLLLNAGWEELKTLPSKFELEASEQEAYTYREDDIVFSIIIYAVYQKEVDGNLITWRKQVKVFEKTTSLERYSNKIKEELQEEANAFLQEYKGEYSTPPLSIREEEALYDFMSLFFEYDEGFYGLQKPSKEAKQYLTSSQVAVIEKKLKQAKEKQAKEREKKVASFIASIKQKKQKRETILNEFKDKYHLSFKEVEKLPTGRIQKNRKKEGFITFLNRKIFFIDSRFSPAVDREYYFVIKFEKERFGVVIPLISAEEYNSYSNRLQEVEISMEDYLQANLYDIDIKNI